MASKEALERRLRLANFSKEIIQQLNTLHFEGEIEEAQIQNHTGPEQVEDQIQPEQIQQPEIQPKIPSVPRGRGKPP